jgi:hypothetical protein
VWNILGIQTEGCLRLWLLLLVISFEMGIGKLPRPIVEWETCGFSVTAVCHSELYQCNYDVCASSETCNQWQIVHCNLRSFEFWQRLHWNMRITWRLPQSVSYLGFECSYSFSALLDYASFSKFKSSSVGIYLIRHYAATSRRVAGSIPDEVIGFFNWFYPSSRTMSLGSNQPLTKMSTRNLPGG